MKKPIKKKYDNSTTMTKNVKEVFNKLYHIELRLYKSNCIIALLTAATLVLTALSIYFHFIK